ncbi:hypothetical protein CDEST_11964 [Colletotrichum destructivum]|uniref:Uncharacterized protein n=1 Tax=Colletotrichum destructivum TaxID=34406 RepID=A0AAX4IUJ0_9PEZI|nr:hypothetical protein CDEST_11964 [Colletotrichum destructivum]
MTDHLPRPPRPDPNLLLLILRARSSRVTFMDISCYAASPEDIDAPVTKDTCHKTAKTITGGHVPPTPVQGQTSYTVAADAVPGIVVQFRQSALDLELINLARQTYGRFVPVCEQRAWINRPLLRHTPQDTQELFDRYESILNRLSQSLPKRFQQKLCEVRQSLPLLFRLDYVMTVNHDDLLEMNIHVDEETGRITGIVD